MPFEINIPLKKFNTFGFEVLAQHAVRVFSEAELLQSLKIAQKSGWPWRVLGSGSNVVLRENLSGLTLLMQIMGKEKVQETPSHWMIEVGAGENWHAFVQWTIAQGWPGLENLALIPGTCGAAPIQNIGAYGLEAGDLIESVRALDTHRLDDANPWVEIKQKDCQFSYRDSLFKKDPKRFIVTKVRFAIPKDWQANLSYAELEKRLGNLSSNAAISTLSAKQIFDTVCEIRRSKLPDPDELGNAGSFFHNPIVDQATYDALKDKFPTLVGFETNPENGQVRFKIAAGWLIDQCGLKGYRQGTVGVYDKQALVLVHYGEGSGTELLELASYIRAKVKEKFGVSLTQEPVIFPE